MTQTVKHSGALRNVATRPFVRLSRHSLVALRCCGFAAERPREGQVKGKVFPYSLPSVGPGADPGVQAVSPQVT